MREWVDRWMGEEGREDGWMRCNNSCLMGHWVDGGGMVYGYMQRWVAECTVER